jgi:nitrate reductase alpha subunit
VAKLADLWLHPKQGTDAALAMAMGHVILKEFYFDKRSAYFDDYARRYTDLPMLVLLKEQLPDGRKVLVPDRYLRASDFDGKLGQANNPEWKTVASTSTARWCCPTAPSASAGAEGRADRPWNLEAKEARRQRRQAQAVGAGGGAGAEWRRGLPYFGGVDTPHFTPTSRAATCWCAACRSRLA